MVVCIRQGHRNTNGCTCIDEAIQAAFAGDHVLAALEHFCLGLSC